MSAKLITYDEWLRTSPPQNDKVCINELAVTALAGNDCWQRKREQLVHISIILSLKGEFFSASSRDVVDESTVHYGKLGKDITAAVSEKRKSEEWLSSYGLATLVERVAQRTAGDSTLLSTCIVELSYPKGSTYGEEAGYRYCVAYESNTCASSLYLQEIRLPLLLGVNEYERKKKQLVVANIWLDKVEPGASDDHTNLENTFIKVISNSTFYQFQNFLSLTKFTDC